MEQKRRKDKKSRKSSNIAIWLMLILGVFLLSYPAVSNYVNSLSQSRVITTYTRQVDEMDTAEVKAILEKAEKHNQEVAESGINWRLDDAQEAEYQSLLNMSGDGVMGFIEIPKIKVYLPIYHGTSDAALQVGVGHIDGSSLPVGGTSSHCILSGHRGLPSSKLFTDLDELEVGDKFTLNILGRVYTYEVDQISIVLPDDLSQTKIIEGEDLVTLVTCTPYGINTHRLLVRGQRIDNDPAAKAQVMPDATQIEPLQIQVVSVIVISVLIIFRELLRTTKRKERGGKK